MADKLNYVGVMAVEFFVTKKGELLVNEMAPRTHNSGHYTVDACVTSQFEQQVRMVCDLPFGDSRLLSPVVMTNLLGDVWGSDAAAIESGSQPKWQELLQSGSSKLHLYGKHEARIGRKMGHFCSLDDNLEQAKAEANSVFSKLSS
jgi:5-(carboxyamino)imidazole ribonucleotide synthase